MQTGENSIREACIPRHNNSYTLCSYFQ